MKEDDKLKHRFGTDTGFRVPEGYFDRVFSEIDAKLPEHPGLKPAAPLPRWQRLKPYVYLAAMFGGIWCTMKMVSMMSDSGPEAVSLDNPPEMIAQAMSTPEVVAQVYSSPSVMVIEDEVFDEPVQVSGTMDTESGDGSVADDVASTDEYSDFVNVADIDLEQLQAALNAEDTADYYNDYYYDYYI